MVRAKFWVTGIAPKEDGGSIITLMAVHSGSEENEKFFKLTPAGNIRLETVNPEAAAQFKMGKNYYVDFTEA